MEPSNSSTLNRHRLLLSERISPDHNDCYRNLILDRMVFTIMVAVISLGVIVFLLFKCFCRSNRSSDENPTDPRPSVDSELKQITVLVYGESTAPWLQSKVESCAICLEEYVQGEKVRVLPRCKHMFHKDCIEEWLQVPSLHCPICRDQVLEHCLQSARSNHCTTQTHNSGNQLHLLSFYGASAAIRATYA
ncbi:hypothetical protein HRI_000276200 [Hibiscus trionum]|uniref:RING-type domain-containing protein n=1 Tax=Hibiscus trionum TaxID=183268 RepID=A0A9W7GUX7_HIBTR|nr:hypothetical protein HRI_000276200 [Hibiscus trionum]